MPVPPSQVDPGVTPEVDAVVLECLAERTLVPALRARQENPQAGADPRLRRRLTPLLPVALNDREILPEHEIVGVLKDAAAAHENAPPGDGIEEMHKAVAELINKIIDGGNSVRRP